MRLAVLAACLIALSATTTATATAAPRLSAPDDLAAPRPTPVRLSGARPGQAVTIVTVRPSGAGTSLVARAVFTADRGGRIDTSRQAPRSGSYAGVDALGLFWSARPRQAEAQDPPAGRVGIAALIGDRIVATAAARVRPAAERLRVTTDTPFPGAVWVRPATPGRHPVIVVLGGSEGGSGTARALAPLFAARGYATLGLPYYSPPYDPADQLPGLPKSFTDIPVDRLADVRAWLAGQADADVARIGIWGASKGAEFALIAASRYPWIRAVAAIVPSDLVWEGWGRAGPPTASFAFAGRPLPFQPYAGMDAELAKASRGEAMDLRRVHLGGRAAFPDRVAAARIPIEAYRGPLLVAGGGRDTIWPSAEMAANIAATRDRAGAATVLLTYPDAGHALGGPGTDPAAPLAALGGDPQAIARARAETWARTFDLFDRALRR